MIETSPWLLGREEQKWLHKLSYGNFCRKLLGVRNTFSIDCGVFTCVKTYQKAYINFKYVPHVLCTVLSLQPCPILCNPTDCSPWNFPVHGVLQARILESLPCPPSGYLPNPRIESAYLKSPTLAGRFFTSSTIWEAMCHIWCINNTSLKCLKRKQSEK